MPKVRYTLDAAIESFFSTSGTSATRAQCDQFASKFGGPVEPVQVQGMNSYTVTAGGHKIVQFREATSPLDMKSLVLAKHIYGDVVAQCTDRGWIGTSQESGLAIYEMDRLLGQNYILARSCLAETADLQLNTVHSLARFFANSWQKRVSAHSERLTAVASECHSRLNYLYGNLPARFMPALDEVRDTLPTLLSGSYPLVLTHSDLNDMNILVDRESGHVTGVVDWADATIQPFGFTLYALDNALGSMGPRGWQYFPNADNLRDEFWRAFDQLAGPTKSEMSTIQVARKAGLLFRYGTPYNSGFTGMVGVRGAGGDDYQYLDALLL